MNKSIVIVVLSIFAFVLLVAVFAPKQDQKPVNIDNEVAAQVFTSCMKDIKPPDISFDNPTQNYQYLVQQCTTVAFKLAQKNN